jgi:hypothetical protein
MAKKALPPAFLANIKKKQDGAKAAPAKGKAAAAPAKGKAAAADKKPAFLTAKAKPKAKGK